MNSVLNYDEFSILEKWNNIIKLNENGKEMSQTQKNYQDFMFFALAKFGAESPADLSSDHKKDMFNWVKDNWDKEKGEAKDPKIKEKIKAAKEKGVIPSKSPAEMGEKGKDSYKEKEAADKKAEFDKMMKED